MLRAELAGSASERAAAFSRLLDDGLDRSFRLAAVILVDRDEAEDAVSDAALRAWQHVSFLRDPTLAGRPAQAMALVRDRGRAVSGPTVSSMGMPCSRR